MVLFDPVVQVMTFADLDRLEPAPGAILQAICGVTGNDRLQVGLATVDDDAVGTTMTCQRLCEEPFGRRQIALLLNQNSTVSRGRDTSTGRGP